MAVASAMACSSAADTAPVKLATLRGAVRSTMIETGTYRPWAERALGAQPGRLG